METTSIVSTVLVTDVIRDPIGTVFLNQWGSSSSSHQPKTTTNDENDTKDTSVTRDVTKSQQQQQAQQQQRNIRPNNNASTVKKDSTTMFSNPIFQWDFSKLSIGPNHNKDTSNERKKPFRQCSKSTIDTAPDHSYSDEEEDFLAQEDHPETYEVTYNDENNSKSQSSEDDEDDDDDNSYLETSSYEGLGSNSNDNAKAGTNSSTYCNNCCQKFESSNDSIEVTLTARTGSVTVCTCKKVKEIEKNLLRKSSIYDLVSSGSELTAAGDYEASRLRYQITLEALQKKQRKRDAAATWASSSSKMKTSSSENLHRLANLCFTLGQLSRKVRDFSAASNYFLQELDYTARYAALQTYPTAGGDLCMAKCYDALARLHQYDIGEWDTALEYYQQALEYEQAAYDKVVTIPCSQCNNGNTSNKTSTTSEPVGHCSHIRALMAHLQQQMQETRKNIGRIHFQNGHLDRALQISIRKTT